jgi:hypothetical protein
MHRPRLRGNIEALLAKLGSYALAFVGIALVARVVLQAMAMNVKYMFARVTFVQTIRSNPRLAEMQCKAAPGTFYDPLGKAFETVKMVGIQDPAIIAQASRPTYDAAATGVGLKWKMMFSSVKKATAMTIAGAGLAIAKGFLPVVQIILAVVAIGALIWIYVVKQETERSVIMARAELLPEVERVFAEGRY